jgi:cytochrome o ubiquinol oxidase subunit 1
MSWHSLIFGRLTLKALPPDLIHWGGAIMVVVGFLAFVGAVTYTKRWKWLWENWLTSLDPKKIGVMYLAVSVLMLVRGGADAILMRTQQALSVGASHGILTANHFQQIFSSHGTIMIFFVAMGIMFGLINLIIPLQIGARDVAFPFINSLSFWFFFAGAMLVNISLVIGSFSTAGWLSYPPLSELAYSPGTGVDYWIWSLQIAGIGSLLGGINFLITIFSMRAKGMQFMKMPLFTWSVIGSLMLVVFAFPILTVTLTLLWLDRALGMHFFTAAFGGNMMMYVNLIWAWGHPEVYILVLPAFGIFSEVVATFSRKHLAGYFSMVLAIGAIVFFSFIVWLHHFFTMGAGGDVNAFFGIMTMVIAIPTGVKIFNWLFTMYRGHIRLQSPMLWFIGFVLLFTLGGVTGVLMAVPPADFQIHNSLFLVAHFHTMIISGVLFGFFAGLTYWFPKIFGFALNDRLDRYAFFSWFTGFILAFMPLYVLGLMGATRRLDHYSSATGWHPLFIVAGIGAALITLGFLIQVTNLIVSIKNRKQHASSMDDPWDGRTLEWSTTSPPPVYNFAVLPTVTRRDEFWNIKRLEEKTHGSAPTRAYEDIEIPKNSSAGFVAGTYALILGFAVVWHIWWLAAVGLLGAVITVTIRALDDDIFYMLPAEEVAKMEKQASVKKEVYE